MRIRKSTTADLSAIMHCIATARQCMRANGNHIQWTNGYPSETLILESIARAENYVCLENNEIVGAFCFSTLPDPTYNIITEGNWLNNAPYGVIHRLASNGKVKGIAQCCMEWCFEKTGNIKADTHIDNIPMQRIFQKMGYTQCGIIFVADGTPRLAYQKTGSKL